MPQVSRDIAGTSSDAAVRSELYRLLARSFRFPTVEFFDAVRSGQYSETLGAVLSAAPFTHREGKVEAAQVWLAGVRGEFDQLCAEYIRLFEVGAGSGKPPCPLFGGEYARRPRLDVMEELVRFYGFFDLALSDSDRELPDHISVELEFVHYLAFRESHALETGGNACTFRRAQADFIERHPGTWLQLLRERLESQAPLPFFRGLVTLTSEVMGADLEYLKSIVASD